MKFFCNLLTVSVNKCGGSCNTIDYAYVPVCVSNKIKSLNIKVLNSMSEINDTRFTHASCEYKF